ncbi:MAG TPA: PDZ domain-containing protein [Candidatus Caccocola faecipullorum]|nr:PDZ domain-containing protein [Candidatus Caccocola faecipullorum]
MRPRFAEKFQAFIPRGNPAAPPAGPASSAARSVLAALFVCGIFAGYCLCSSLESAMMSAALEADAETARAVSRRGPSFANAGRSGGAGGFTEENPFGADVRAAKDTEKSSAAKAAPETLKSMTLRGTLPGVGAWIEVSGNTRLVLKGQSVEGFTLSEIEYSRALLSGGAEEHALYLILSGGGRPAAADRRRPRRAETRRRTQQRAPEKPALDFSGLEPASEGREGAVPRELVDALLMNPYDELAKVRMVPTPDMSGMRLERLASDSVLARVGVAQGDVISAINGVSITNVADASNALNSLMAGTRFDVTVMRGGKPVELRYQVK